MLSRSAVKTVGIEINRSTIFKTSKHSQSLTQFSPPQPFQNRTIPPAFCRVSVCVCLYGFASVQNSGHTRLRRPCLACSSRCTEPLHPHNHCKRTTYPRHAPHSCLACLSHCTALSPPHHTRLTTTFFSLQKQLYPFSRLFNCSNLFRTSLTSPRPRAILLLALAKTNLI